MKFALVNGPDQEMLRVLSQGRPYHLALAQYVLDHPYYADFYAQESFQGSYILLDNGADEGEQQQGEALVEAACRCEADELVLPDTILSPRETYEKSRMWLAQWGDDSRLSPGFRFCYVLQIRCREDLVGAFDDFLFLRACMPEGLRVTSVAITKDFEPHGGSRMTVLDQLIRLLHQAHLDFVDIHLLGIWNDPYEVVVAERRWPRRIRGVDSSLPIVFAFHDRSVLMDPRRGLDVDLEDPALSRAFKVWPERFKRELQIMDVLATGRYQDGYAFPEWRDDASTNGAEVTTS